MIINFKENPDNLRPMGNDPDQLKNLSKNGQSITGKNCTSPSKLGVLNDFTRTSNIEFHKPTFDMCED